MCDTGLPSTSVLQVISSIDNEAAGTTYCVRRLSETLKSIGDNVEILSVGSGNDHSESIVRTRRFSADGANVPGLRTLLFSSALREQILKDATAPQTVIHSNGLWRMPNVYPGEAARRLGVPLIVSPHGMLGDGALKFSAKKKQVFSALFQRRALNSAACFHATSYQEYQDIRRFGLVGPVAIIPNGIDMPTMREGSIESTIESKSRRSVLYLGRVHPKKGLAGLLKAWSCLERDFPNWDLNVVGPSEGGHVEELLSLASSLRIERVTFHPGLFGEEKDTAYRQADLFVLPTLDENFAMVVAEALSHGTPVICSKGAPWADLETNGCGWWVDHGSQPLEAALREAMVMPRTALDSMGQKGRDWMARDFSWSRIAKDMSDVYRWCLGHLDKPSAVVVD